MQRWRGSNGIKIAAANITVDLNGFTVRAASGTDRTGIVMTLGARGTIRNGFITGWARGAATDVSVLGDSEIENVRVLDCTVSGITGRFSHVIGCIVTGVPTATTTVNGIHLTSGAIVRDCRVSGFKGTSGVNGLLGANTIRNLVVRNSVPGQGTGIDAAQSVRDLNQIAPEHGPAELDTLTNPYLNFGK